MANLLHIETATKVCSVALSKNDKLIDCLEVHEADFSHSEKLNLLILELLDKTGLTFKDIDAIAVSGGPGSYTGLRIGVSSAKGICFACDIPLISVNTLEALAHQVNIASGMKIPMIDARRMEVYTSFYDINNQEVKKQHNLIVEEHSFDELNDYPIYLFGNGSNKLKDILVNKVNINFIDDIECTAKSMISLAYTKFSDKDFVDVAYYEPNYGKEFYTTAKI